ncbi:helix-turn-helix transcriptional regulator [Streptomyces flavidovirens]|uniref:helix-turn-helix domain-containing protein n=1 Tax=Streptomyces flavidovirens TaxID=67298 RepID=UPI003447B2F7
MGLRTTISERQHRLAFELKKLREQAGLNAGEAAQRIGMGRAQLSQIETARTSILTDRLRDLCRAYGCKDSPYVDALVAMSEATGKGWWSAYKNRIGPGAHNLAELEASATELRFHESLFIPGLFQTEDYARAIFKSPKLGFENVDDALAFRMERQHILTGERPPVVHAVIHEAALHMRFGGAATLRGQLLRLIELAQLPNVTIQIFPFTAEAYAAFTGNFLHARPVVPELGTVVLEQPTGSLYLSEREQLSRYETLFGQLTEHALPPINPQTAPESHFAKDSLALIQHLLYAL